MYGIHKLHERHENVWWIVLMCVAVAFALLVLAQTVSGWLPFA